MENQGKITKTVSIKIKAPEVKNGQISIARPGDISLGLSTNEDLGRVQSFIIDASVGNIPTAKITTIMSNLEADILQENTELIISDSRQSSSLYYLEENLLEMCEDYIKNNKHELFPYIQRLYDYLNGFFDNYGDLLYQLFEKKYSYEYLGYKKILDKLNVKIKIKSIVEDKIKQIPPKEEGDLTKLLKSKATQNK